MNNQTKYVTVVEPVLEVSLVCQGESAPWHQPLAAEGMTLPPEQEKVELILSGVETRYMGVKFRELSISLRLDEERVFLVHAFNSNPLFAWAERTVFRTPYYHGALTVTPRQIRLMDKGQPLLEATLPPTATATHNLEEVNNWQIVLPAALRKQPDKAHYFKARLEGATQYFALTPQNPSFQMNAALPPSLHPLRASNLIIEKWLVRERARHSKSETLTQE